MRNFTKYLLTMMVIVLSSTVMLAQLRVSSSGGKALLLPESRSVLYEQSNSSGSGRASQDFEPAYDAYDCQGADDFYVPAGLLWIIQTVTVTGTGSLTATVANVLIYADAGGIPAATATNSLMGLTCTNASGVLTIPIPGGLPLAPGHYWISVQDAAPYVTYGQWFWTMTSSIYNSQSCWRNPGGGFGGPTVWTTMTALGYPNADFMFRLEGTSGPVPTCDYQINLLDWFGDGWNGGSLDVLVNGTVVLDNITNNLPYPSYGPVTYYFNVPTGGMITTVYTAGSWPEENYYYIYNSEGSQVWYSTGSYPNGPPNIMPGQLYGSCPMTGAVDGYVFNYDGLAVSGATIIVENGPTTTSGPNGYYLLEDVNGGSTTIACTKTGYNTAIDVVAVEAGDTVPHNFTLTQPNMVINPLLIEETLNPGEYFTTSLNVLNNGNGPLGWEAVINYPETDNSGGNYIINPPGYQTEQVEPNGAASTGYGTVIENGSRDLMICPEGSLFSIPPVSSTNAYTSTLSAGYKCYQSFSGVEGAISTVTFWGVFAGYTLPTSPGNFLIELRQPGSTPGAVVTSVTIPLVGVNTGQLLLGSYQIGIFTAEVPPTDLAAGWLAVQFQASPIFYWNNTQAGAGFPALQNSVSLPERLAMCLGGGGGAGNWLTMDYYEGTVPPFGGVANIPTHLDAAGTSPGEVYTADVVFTSNPNVSTITVPVTMIIMGNELIAPENLEVTLINDITGEVGLTWEWNGDAFQFFMIKRDGVIVGTTTNMSYVDVLPDYGEYCYTVQAVYDEGSTSPAGPECIEWPNPVLYVNPSSLEGWVWVGFTVDVYTTISNLGLGTLAYTFPEFAALNLLNDPNIEKNKTGSPVEIRSDVEKGDESYNGNGYPVILGAGGPDDFGYVWIDSDESGGPTFNWIDIAATGTAVPLSTLGDDGKAGPYNMGFDFEFYGEVKSQFWVASNGAVCFNSAYFTYSNTGIPTNNSANVDFIAGFWDDLYSTYAGVGVYYQQFADYTIVQWNDAQRLSYPGYMMDFQFIMYRNGKIKVQYKDISAGFTLTSSTEGIQSSTPSLGLQVSMNTNYVHNNLAILYSLPADFIVAVEPAFGTVAEGESQGITITYDSQDYEPGDYTQELLLESNDPNNQEFIINNTMHVYVPAQFAGTVIDNDDDNPLPGVTVTAGAFQTTTGDEGQYSLYVDQGTYDVVFEKLGYMDVTVADTFALAGIVTPITVGMWDMNYAPGFVHAEVMDNDTWCAVTWTLPDGPYEIVMDDGEADDYFIYSSAGSMNAVKFTPTGYPAIAMGGQIYVGDGSFPGPFLGSEFGIAIFDDDGPGGLPGTMLDSNGVTVNNYGWVSFDWLSASIESGSFYLAMIQTAPSPFAAPIGVDTDNPTYFKSYIHFLGAPSWVLSPLQDFMMRAWVDGPESDAVTDNAMNKVWRATPRVPANWQQYAMTASGTLPRILPGYERNDVTYKGVEGMDTRDVTNYRVARYSNFDPNGSPAAGTLTELATTGNLYYNDYAWAGLPMGWYAYGVKALYTSGLYSNYQISNIVGHLMDYQVTVNVTLSTGLEPINVEVTLHGLEYPYETLFAVTPASGTVVFDPVWRGHYDLSAFKIGYDTYKISNTFINGDKVFNIMLSEKKYPPTCLYVDPVSLIATWCEPMRTAVNQGFEDPIFPPAGWQNFTQGDAEGWFRTDDGSGPSWPIPSWDSFYACANDDAAGSLSDGCCDYLITPPVDLRESLGYAMSFNSYYDGAFGQLAFVEYSVDGGATWEVFNQLMPATSWTDQELDLADFSGPEGFAQIWFAFHSDDSGDNWGSGWAIDNVLIQVPAPAANYLDFWVFLDDAFEGVTMETTWDYAPLMYGHTYTASVAARYTSGLSDKDYYTFFCEYLFPPDSLTGYAPDDAAILEWTPPIELWPLLATAGITYEEYLAENNLQNIRSNDAPSAGRAPQVNINLPDVNPFEGLRDLDSKAWACDALANNMVTFTLGTPGTLNYLGPGAADFLSAADIVEGVYYATIYGGTFLSMDTATGAFTTIGGTADLTGLAYDYTTETMYGVDFGGTLYTIDLATGASTVVGNTGGVLIDCACDNDGILYAVDIGSDVFGSIDKTTATFTTISNLPFDANYAQGMQCDHGANIVYHAAYNNSMGAGQLYSVEQATGTYNLIGNFQGNTEVDGFAMPGGGTIIPVPVLPDNLLGYNVYRDMEFVAYTPHTPPGVIAHQNYVDEGLQPGIYQYTVTAVYDLTPYGYAGETGESMEEGPAEVIVAYCYDLEFMETWALGNFDDNNWTSDGANWSINGQAGNPAPAAEFTWDPIQTDYEISLESYPLCAVGMTEGKMWLDFDLKLDAVQPTGEEMLHAQVWNWETQTWSTAATYSNVDGSFGWRAEHLNIKAQAMDQVFKIRFHAMGVNSIDIESWFVDNIHVYRTCDSPTDLTSSINYGQAAVVLNWVEPEGSNIDEWLRYDDGENAWVIGTNGPVVFDAAIRWEPAQLVAYDGASVTEISFFPAEVAATYKVRVWTGPVAANLVVDQAVANPLIGEWNTVTLTTPVPIDITQELWVGYNVDATTGYPAGADAGPAVDGYGNWMNFGGWQTLLEINPEFDYNWNLAAHVMTVAGVSMPLPRSVEPYNNAAGLNFVAHPNNTSVHQVFAPGNGSRELSGYNIYRSIEGGEYVLIDFTTGTTYTDANLPNALYCYMVSAVWASETDQCESAFTNETCEIMNVSITDPNATAGSFSLYPNPADDHVYIATSGELKRVTVYNALGQLVIDEITTGKQYELSTATYTIGVYMVRVETAAGVTTRTLTIQR